MKRFTALTMIFLLVLGYWPQGFVVFASYQERNTGFQIINDSPTTGTAYDLRFTWRRPLEPALPYENEVTWTDLGDGRATLYHIFMRNATAGQGYGSQPIEVIEDAESETLMRNFPRDFPRAPEMQSGNIYMFQVQPAHYHIYGVGNNAVTGQAPYMAGGAFSEFGFMTDIDVTATGSGNTLSVTWNNPTINGADIFSGYRIWYMMGESNTIPDTVTNRTVTLNNPELIRNPNGTLTFNIVDNELQINGRYSIKVEPILNNSIFRRLNTPSVTLPDGTRHNIAFTSREYRTTTLIRPSLTVLEETSDQIRLIWSSFSEFSGHLERIAIQESDTDDFESPRTIAIIEGTEHNQEYVKNINSWMIVPPQGAVNPVYFRILITFRGEEIPSEIAVWYPGHVNFTPYKPTILSVLSQGSASLTHVASWEAFLRPVFPGEEGDLHSSGLWLDRDMEYDIWITDSLDNLNNRAILSDPRSYAAADLTMNESNDIFIMPVAEFMRLNEDDGTVEWVPFEENKVYYMRIVARRPDTGELSTAANYVWYIPPVDDVPTDPLAMSTPPLRLTSTDMREFGIEWSTKWFEIYDSATNTWHSIVGVDSNNEMVFGSVADTLDSSRKLLLYSDEYVVNSGITPSEILEIGSGVIFEELARLTGSSVEDLRGIYAVRFLDLEGMDYAIHVVQFDTMMQAGGFDSYYRNNLYPFGERISAWQAPVNYGGTSLRPSFTVTQQDSPSVGPVIPNTAYVVYFIAYTTIDSELHAASYPSNLSVTTQTEREDVIPDPPVPTVTVTDITDMTVTVRFRYDEGISYDLSYSNLGDAYPNGGTIINYARLLDEGRIVTEQDSEGNTIRYLEFTVTGLFPETRHYFWVRTYTSTASRWSNPAEAVTGDVATPLPPQGIGLISESNLEIINTENNTEFSRAGEDYVIMEWMRDQNDIFNAQTETASGLIPQGTAQELVSQNIRFTRIVKFNELIANRAYFARVKTKVTVTQSNEGVVRYYTYTIQLSQTNEFVDVIEIVVPSNVPTNNQGATIERESEWSRHVTIYTDTTDSEYDGNINPELYPLPLDDFEITYDRSTETLTYRFRSDHEGDYNVDQRFISRITNMGIFEFSIDLTNYDNRSIRNRVVDIPYSVIQAFDERKISLQIVSGNMAAMFRPDWISTMETANIPDFGVGSRVMILLEQDPSNLGLLDNSFYASAPHRVSAQIETPSRAISMNYTNTPIKVDLKLQHRSLELDYNVGTYVFTNTTSAWNLTPSVYDNVTGIRTMDVTQLGAYAAIALNNPAILSDGSADASAMYSFRTRMTITDMPSFQPNNTVHALQFNNLVMAIAQEKSTFEFNANLSSNDINMLARANMYVSGAQVTREQAISTMVNLYEIKTNTPVSFYPSLETSMYPEIANAADAYRTNLLKAESLGFFQDESQARLQDNITLGELIYIADAILQDANI